MHFIKRFVILILACVPMLAGCGERTDLFAYTRGAAEFTLGFPSVSGDTESVVCAAVRDENGNLTLSVTSPERLCGFTAEIAGETVSVGAEDMRIPLSHEVSGPLLSLARVLVSEGSPSRSSDGVSTVITSPSGTVVLDAELCPCEVTAGTITAGIAGFKFINPTAGTYET